MASTGDNGSKNVSPPEDEKKRSSVSEARARRGILWRSIVVGPDAVEAEEPEGHLEVLLSWPVRFLGVAAAFSATWFWRDSAIGQQIAWGLQIGALAAVAIVASFWLHVLVADSVMAAAWLLPFRPPEGRRRRWSLLHVIAFVNRQLGHIAALFVWILVSFGIWAWLPGQIGASFAVILLGTPVLNGLARIHVKNEKGIAARAIGFIFGTDGYSKFSGELLWRRRVLIYLATAVGLGVMVFAAPKQTLRLLPLILAISVGMAIRIVRHWQRRKRVREEVAGEKTENVEARADFRREQARAARNADLFAPVLVLGGFMLLVGASYWHRQKLEDSLRTAFEDTESSSDGCARDRRGPETADISLFVLADTHMHALAGEPFPGQTELVAALIKKATRPLALEMLSAVPLKHFASVYARLKEDRPNMLWAYLGDMADLGCRSELERMYVLFKDFVRVGPLAGIALGNHEMSFQGSSHWSPYWNAACASEPARKDEVSRDIVKNFANEIERNKGEFLRLESSFLNFRGGSLSAVSPLGVVEQTGRTAGVIGVFLDTSDGKAFDKGMPGSVGAGAIEPTTRSTNDDGSCGNL